MASQKKALCAHRDEEQGRCTRKAGHAGNHAFPAPRKTLWWQGRKGAADWMRVVQDDKQGRVEVKFKDAQGLARREYFPNDRKGRAAAVTWAEEFAAERKRLGSRVAGTTHAALWKAYTESPAWAALHETSKPSYVERWNHWQRERGAGSLVDDTTLHHIDRYTTKAIAAGKAVNQVRNVLNVARVVYNWGFSRKLIAENAFAGFRWKAPAGHQDESPEEYTQEEFEAILAELDPRESRSWRAHVMLLLAGYHGQRGRALTHFPWPAIELPAGEPVSVGALLRHADRIVWPAAFQKTKKALEQPLTWEGLAALCTAAWWREQLGYGGPWVLPGGAAAARGEVRERKAWELDPKHKRVGTGKGKPRAVGDRPYTYSAGHRQLVEAEQGAGVAHKPRRAFHGFRKMSAGNVADRTGDVRLALEWIGDDIRQAPKYLKKRENRLQRAAEAAGTGHTPRPNGSRRTVREVSEVPGNENAPAATEALTLTTTRDSEHG